MADFNFISFPATQVASADPNALDDYEEGVWTPTQGAGLTVVGTFTSSGSYTKIGRQVTLMGQISAVTSITVAASGVFVGGVPFNPVTFNAMGIAMNGAANASTALICPSASANVLASTAVAASTSFSFVITYFV